MSKKFLSANKEKPNILPHIIVGIISNEPSDQKERNRCYKCGQLLTPLSWKFAFIGGKVAIGNDFHVAWQFFISRVPFYQEKKEWCFV